MYQPVRLTVLMPCLNEAETLEECIRKARAGIAAAGLSGEILVADNGSTDGSPAIAQRAGARVVHVAPKGYGSALAHGMKAATGDWIIMGDADDSYDFSRLDGFIAKFRQGFEVVVGCRLPNGGGVIKPGAMPWKNRWLGNPVLSRLGRLFFGSSVCDFHCGLRGVTQSSVAKLDLQTTGMEFASEMIIKATLQGLRVGEVPIVLHKDGRSRRPHLRPWRDGWRHLRFMLLFSPRWLFLWPGLVLCIAGISASLALSLVNLSISGIELTVGTLVVACMTTIIGVQLVSFAFYTKVFAIAEGLLPEDPRLNRLFRIFTLEKGLLLGFAILATGVGLLLYAVWIWKEADYGVLSPEENLRRLIPAAMLITLGVQTMFSSFFMSALGLRTRHRRPPNLTEPPHSEAT